jgi:acetoin utilization protein AcuB
MLVRHWMTRDPIAIEADTPFLEARLVLRDRRIRHLPVVEQGRLLGVVTDRDLKEAAPSGASTLDVYEMNYLLLKIKVRELIKRAPITIRGDDGVERAALLMHDHRIGCLPVLDDTGHLVGLITATDLLAAIIEILGYREPGTRIAFEVPDGPDACHQLGHLLHDHRMDLRSLLTCTLHTRPGYRDFVIRVKGEQAEALADEIRTRYGVGVNVFPS